MTTPSFLPARQKNKPRLAYVVTHRLADIDAYCSAYATAKMLRTLGVQRVRVVLPNGLSTAADNVYERYPLRPDGAPNFGKADLIAIVDTNNPLLLSDSMDAIIESGALKLLIDHHPPSRDTGKLAGPKSRFIDTAASSACEVVYTLYRRYKVRITGRVAQVLLLGILADSQHLFLAGGRTIGVVNDLLGHGASLGDARGLLMRERDLSERMARLKAAHRASLYTAGNFVVAFSHVGSFHASAAKALVDLGADLAVVLEGGSGKQQHNKAKASMRATQRFYARSGLHLGTDVASKLSDAGGGHPTAASLSADVSEDELAKMLIKTLEARLGRLNMIR